MPLSRYHEWVSHELEKVELKHIELAMTRQEAALYAQLRARLELTERSPPR